MGKSSKPEFPDPPQFQPDPFLQKTQQGLFNTGDALRQGLFLNPDDPTVGFLNDLVTLNPEATQTAVGLATRDVERVRNEAQQSILNQLEANNQLTSSTTGTALTELNREFSADISDIASQFYLADVERAFTNTANLFGLGLQTLDTVGARGLENQAQTNEFALNRFDRQVALEAERFSRQQANEAAQAQTVGFFSGPLGGAIYGGFNSGSQGAQAGLSGGIQGVQFATNLASTFSGLGSGGGQVKSTSLPSSVNQSPDFGLRLRDDLLAQRRFGGLA